jgi:hypothetical protein
MRVTRVMSKGRTLGPDLYVDGVIQFSRPSFPCTVRISLLGSSVGGTEDHPTPWCLASGTWSSERQGRSASEVSWAIYPVVYPS